MGSWSFVTTVQHMQVVPFIGPDDRAVMMVAAALPVQSLRFGETAILRIIGDDHGIGAALVVRCGFGVPIVNDIEPLLQIDGLRPLPAIVEHLDFPSLAEGQNPGGFVKGRGVGADRNANRHEDDAKKDAMLHHFYCFSSAFNSSPVLPPCLRRRSAVSDSSSLTSSGVIPLSSFTFTSVPAAKCCFTASMFPVSAAL